MVWLQVPSPLQESAVQASPSSQLYAVPAQTPALQMSWLVHALPSLHAVPVDFAVQLVALVLGVQAWHWFAGLVASAA
jgi:hypothetical protein